MRHWYATRGPGFHGKALINGIGAVLIPEVEPSRWWEWVLHNQRGIILERAIRRGTGNVVLCRLRYRLGTLTATPPRVGDAGTDARTDAPTDTKADT